MSDYTLEDAKRDLIFLKPVRRTPWSEKTADACDRLLTFIESLTAEIERLRETADLRARDAFLLLVEADAEQAPQSTDLPTERERDLYNDRDRWKAKAEWLANKLGGAYKPQTVNWLQAAEEATK